MEAFLAQVAATARKASDQRYCKPGRPPVQQKSAAAGCPLKNGADWHRSPSVPAINKTRHGTAEPKTHKRKALNPYGCTEQCHSVLRLVVLGDRHPAHHP